MARLLAQVFSEFGRVLKEAESVSVWIAPSPEMKGSSSFSGVKYICCRVCKDKEWSLTDCISFVAMRDEGLTDALTGALLASRARLVRHD